MDYEDIRYELDGAVATVTLNRPAEANCLTRQMRAELLHAVKRAGGEARALVLTGAGRAFCAGQDLGGKRASEADLEAQLRDEYEPLLRAMMAANIPLLAAVNGQAAGPGANLAFACDVVIAARSASFAEAQPKAGLMPDFGATYLLPRLAGLPRAMGMALFAEPIPAPQAADWGLIWEVADDPSLRPRARELAERLAAGPTRAYAALRQTMRAGLANTLDDQLIAEREAQAALTRSRDFAEGRAAQIDGRAPGFEGR